MEGSAGQTFNLQTYKPKTYVAVPGGDYVHWIASSWYPPVNNSSKDSQMPVETASPPLSPPSFSPILTTSNKNVHEYDPELVDQYG
ncbi:hypothetical protein HPULCUR_009446 [Helicostylum pulchrum]|uniref:Uncharacterized protein n=1 Tax=Helicostylum pulchrum TaxID=562976 RepID=A0ABP9YAI1_9FUNG